MNRTCLRTTIYDLRNSKHGALSYLLKKLFRIKTSQKNNKKSFSTWDAFVSFMEQIYWEGILEESTPEFISFSYEQFKAALA
jgi:hypothetical protein